MCGIAASFPLADHPNLNRSLLALAHRGPDEQRLSDTQRGTLAHTRLAIQDVEHAHQPMHNAGSWIVFNGEIYNFRQLMQLLPDDFETDSDTETVLRLYQHLGVDCVALLDGMFAFALLDGENMFAARDPLGIKPLYFGLKDENLYFASEFKALLHITADIHEFPAGHWWHSAHGLHSYYRLTGKSIRESTPQRKPTPAAYAAIRQGLEQAVHKRLLADASVGVGVSLSGGLDSSLVTALAASEYPGLKTFAAGMAGSPDLGMARKVADHIGTQHFEAEYTLDDILAALPRIIYHLESFDAALVRSAIPNYFLARLAREQVKVLLTGEGADETFAGYDYLETIRSPQDLQTELLTITHNLHNTNLQRADRMGMAFGLEARVPFLDRDFVRQILALPARWKLRGRNWPEKAMLRQAFHGLLPEDVLWRKKAKFSQGAGSMNALSAYAQETVSTTEIAAAQEQAPVPIKSAEETLYYRHFKSQLGTAVPARLLGRTRSVVAGEI